MRIVIEGPDGAGKSTLAAKIGVEAMMRGLEVRRYHSTGPGRFMEYLDMLRGPNFGQLGVYDRLHYGELVYGTTRRQYPNFGFKAVEQIDTLVGSMGGRVVVLAPPCVEMMVRLDERGEQVPDLMDELDRFEFIARVQQLSNPRVVQIWQQWDPCQLAKKLVNEVLDL